MLHPYKRDLEKADQPKAGALRELLSAKAIAVHGAGAARLRQKK